MVSLIHRLNSRQPDYQEKLHTLLAFEDHTDHAISQAVQDIIAAVRAQGDDALLQYTQRFDRVAATSMAELEITQAELAHALNSLDPTIKAALQTAADRIRRYHEEQAKHSGLSGFRYHDELGNVLGQNVHALNRVGIYVPGGKAAYPSSVLMNAIPARVAGVNEIIMVVPTPDQHKNQLVLAAAAIANVDRVFTVGGAQAIAALAYGTDTIPAVDKITGPGNAYVAEAKRRVFGKVGIDMIAGPSEILVIADGSVNPDWIARDLFSQAEHDELAQAILISPSAEYLDQVEASMHRLLEDFPRKDIIRTSLQGRGVFIHAQDLEEACTIANVIAPEHLELAVEHPETWAEKIHHAGAVFVGAYASEALGDYCAGPNHVLPTSGTARFSSPLGILDFVKRSSYLHISENGAQVLGHVAHTLALGEGLQAHAASAASRLKVSE